MLLKPVLRSFVGAVAFFIFAIGDPPPVHAQAEAPSAWQIEKCARYSKSWSETLAKRGSSGLGRDFLDGHAAFIGSNCLAAAAVCPRSPQELSLANAMVIFGMNQGLGSTFMPFACRGARSNQDGR